MTVPLWGRVIAAVVGGVLVIIVWSSVIGALIVSRPVGSRLIRIADTCVDGMFRMLVRHLDDGRRDRTLAVEAAAILLGQLAAWLGVAYLGISLLLWPFEPHGAAAAFVTAGRCREPGPAGRGSPRCAARWRAVPGWRARRRPCATLPCR